MSKMHRSLAAAALTLLVAGWIAPGQAFAQKKGGGGNNPPPPPGTIYFDYGPDTWRMQGDGSGKTPAILLPHSTAVPSRQTYGDGGRWWLVPLSNAETSLTNLWATDGLAWIQLTESSETLNEDGTYTLINFAWGTPSWSNDGQDSFVSTPCVQAIVRKRDDGSRELVSDYERSIYRFEVSALHLEAILELDLVDPKLGPSDGVKVIRSNLFDIHNFVSHHWSPDGARLAYVMHSADQSSMDLYVADVAVEAADGLDGSFIYGNVYAMENSSVQWAPTGTDQIAFSSRNRIFLAQADGSGVVDLTEGRAPFWSPDGQHLVYNVSKQTGWNSQHFIYRISVSGGAAADLSGGLDKSLRKLVLGWCAH